MKNSKFSINSHVDFRPWTVHGRSTNSRRTNQNSEKSLAKVYFLQKHQQRSFGILKRFFKIIILSRAMSDHYPKAGYYRPFSEFSAFVISICIFKVVKVYYYDSLFMTHYRFKYELSFWPMRDNLTNNDRLFVS